MTRLIAGLLGIAVVLLAIIAYYEWRASWVGTRIPYGKLSTSQIDRMLGTGVWPVYE